MSPPPLSNTFLHGCYLFPVYLKPGPRLLLFVPLRLPFGAFSFYLTPFSMSLSLSMSLASPTSFLFLWCSPSSLPCLLQQKIQHRPQHVCLCVSLYDGSAGKPHMLVSKEVIKKKSLMHVCQTPWSKHWLLKVTSQPCKHTPLNH